VFTGIVQSIGEITHIVGGDLRVRFDPGWIENDALALGESIAVNGCCLTIVAADAELMDFEMSPETLDRTALRRLAVGHRVNLERAMRPADRFGGHIVQGHVDGIATLVHRHDHGDHHEMRFRVVEEADRYLIDKGSVTLDGISLTVVRPNGAGEFDVWVIPHTFEHTTLRDLLPGDPLNVEYDVLAKHVERLLRVPQLDARPQ
jgi:riboflavin synthase